MATTSRQIGGISGISPATPEGMNEALARPLRMPWLGLGLVGASVAFSLALVVFFAGWGAADRASARSLTATGQQVSPPSDKGWWEDGARWVCPLH